MKRLVPDRARRSARRLVGLTTLVAAVCLTAGAAARPGGPGRSGGIKPGQTRWYEGKCVTITRVAGQQVSYRYKIVTRRSNGTSSVKRTRGPAR